MSANSIQARLQYLIPTDEKPIYIASQGGAQAQLKISAGFEDHLVTIHDARRQETPAELDKEGFALRAQHTEVDDFYALDDWQVIYETELSRLVLETTGASELLVFDHTLRSNSSGTRGEHDSREPATVIHNDYTDASAEKRLRDLLPTEESDQRVRSRFAIINVWRSIRGPVVQSPLALCDARTVTDQDLVTAERRAADRIGELQLASWNPKHRWSYYPLLRKDEALLIKTFDSALDGHARRAIHTAFHNPAAPKDAAPRESIESRMLVFYE